MPTKLQFDNEHSITVDEDLTAAESAMRTAPPGVAGVVSFKVDGEKVFVNAALVRAFSTAHEPASPQTMKSPFG
jgi:hypothetical protein